MAKLLHIFYHKEGTFSLLCQQVQLFTHSNCQLYNSYLHLSFRSIIYKKLPIASHFYIHVTSAAEKASALFYPLSHTRMDK